MVKKFGLKNYVIAALCVALCVVLPMAFHAIPNAGSILLPMHIPVLLCGLLCGWPLGLICGLAGPLLSSLLTGMPGAAFLPAMMIELAVYGLVSGLLMRFVRTGKLLADLYVSLIGAMLVGRIISGLARALLFSAGGYSMAVWATSYFVTGLPGIAIQLLILPPVVLALEKAHIVPKRYPVNN